MIPPIGANVEILTEATRYQWHRTTVAAHTTSGDRPAFTVNGLDGVFVDSDKGEFWRCVPGLVRAYLSSAFTRKLELRALAEALRRAGHVVVSTWHDDPDDRDDVMAEDAGDKAERDLAEIRQAEVFVAFTPGSARGGRHFEAGFACALGLRLIAVGPVVEHHFHRLRAVERVSTKAGLLRVLGGVG
jgi:hypothetical protein